MNTARSFAPYAAADADDQPEPHFGDLRKGAYLKRRAEYQLHAEPTAARTVAEAPEKTPPSSRDS
ncbi:MAG: hypothetical protein KDJ27_05270 [Gammaproteobacteria bacterium]|nr:hypothetical protein [Gammaproteobacteria bacterium]MCB1923149.1 hypothetical protein [Gammaproteobacteria bacterium]